MTETNIYIDESGSMVKDNEHFKTFVICLIIPNDKNKLKKVFKRYISKNIDKLRKLDKKHKMFDKNGKFKEIKGYCLDKNFKLDFIKYFTKNELFNIYYIHLDNQTIDKKIYKSTARAFNYPLKLLIKNFIVKDYKSNLYTLNIDERNEKTNTKYFLQEYLNTEIGLFENIDFIVNYFDSENSKIIQIADVFANIYYSNTINQDYNDILKELEKNRIIKKVFYFPPKNKKKLE